MLFSYAKITFQTLIAIAIKMIDKKLHYFLGLMLINILSQAQNLKNDSFLTAMEIKDSIIGVVNVFKAEDPKQVLYTYPTGITIEKQHAAVFKFIIEKDTLLTFDIVPKYKGADYDFLLFHCATNTCLDEINAKKLKPIRYCLTENDGATGSTGSTGLSKDATLPCLAGGQASPYASALPVKKGEIYYLVVNYGDLYLEHGRRKFPEGFTIYFYNYWPQKSKLKLPKQQIPQPMLLESVPFETDKSDLQNTSIAILDKLVTQLQTNKTIHLEIGGHTDNQGNEISNQLLSEKRAKIVYDYLVSKNIDRTRLFFKGFGSTKPVASNETEEGQKKNRRVEFKVLAP